MTTVLTANALRVIESRIADKDPDGNPIEDADGIFRRVARHIATAEETDRDKWTERFYDLMASLKFLPNSPCLVNAGRPLGQLSACFVLPIDDSMKSIMKTLSVTAAIHKSGGGTGFSFSRLRPNGSAVASTAGVASGPVGFMQMYDHVTEAIKQGGTRRGANMGILRVDHDDIIEFIRVKSDPTKLQNFNISVAITDQFMELLQKEPNTTWKRNYTVAEVWRELIHNAWLIGDPGLFFIDRVNASASNPVPALGPIEATNPCGEQALYAYDSCNLGSINLAKFVSNGRFDTKELEEAVSIAVRFLDDVVTVTRYPTKKIAKVSRSLRRIGLGVMGWADALYELNIGYDTQEAVKLASELMQFIKTIADNTSNQLAFEKGSFPLWENSIYANDRPYRNACRTTVAPTGTLSIIAGCSSGIEPNFGLAFDRSHYIDRTDANKRVSMREVNPILVRRLAEAGIELSPNMSDALARGMPLTSVLNGHGEDFARVFRTAHDITPEWHVKMQAAFQSGVDNSISKTINFPNSATEADVDRAYWLAWELGCKGITIYRDGCRDSQVLSFTQEAQVPVRSHVRTSMPRERQSITHKFRIGDFEGYMTVGFFEDGLPGEVFLIGAKSGSTINGLLDTIAMLTSFNLQHGVPVEDLCEKLLNIRFEPAGMTNNPDVPIATSIADYLARYLLRLTGNQTKSAAIPTAAVLSIADYTNGASADLCPDCGGRTEYIEGCHMCRNCGYNRCS